MAAHDIETQTAVELKTISSTWTQRRQRQEGETCRSTNRTYTSPPNDKPGEQLLHILSILNFHRGTIFSVPPSRGWNLRQHLGKGASFEVDEGELPIRYALDHSRYRDLYVKGPEEDYNFIDHTKTAVRTIGE